MFTKINSDLAIWWHIRVKKCQYCYWRQYHSPLCLMFVMVGPDRAAENFCAVFSLISFPKIYSSSYPAFATWFDVRAKHCGAGGLTEKKIHIQCRIHLIVQKSTSAESTAFTLCRHSFLFCWGRMLGSLGIAESCCQLFSDTSWHDQWRGVSLAAEKTGTIGPTWAGG